MSISKIKERFLAGNLVLHCSSIRLEQCGVGAAPKIYSGTGSLQLDPRKGFSGSFVSLVSLHPFAQLLDHQNLISGQIVPDSYFYSLVATSVDGKTWSNPKVAIELGPDTAGTLVTFDLDFLVTSWPANDAARVEARLVFLELLPFPLTAGTHTRQKGPEDEQSSWRRDRGEFRTPRMHMKYREWKDVLSHSEFTVIFSELAPVGFDIRLVEALRFATALPVSWVMLEHVRNGEVHLELNVHRPAQNNLVNGPLKAQEFPDHFFRLFEAYFVHSCGHAKGEEFSQLSTAIGALFSLKSLDISQISLVVGVAIEALLAEGFSDIENADPELLQEVRSAEAMLDSMGTIRENSRARMKGSIGGLKSVRAQDKLVKLEKSGLISSAELQHWKKLRNTSAHGAVRKDPQKWQEHIQRIFAVTTLAYKLAFLRIGYFGPYTDYGSPGWPVAWFPDKADAEALTKAVQELKRSSESRVQDKLHAWQAAESALRNASIDSQAGASRLQASLVLLATMKRAGTNRLAELRSNRPLTDN